MNHSTPVPDDADLHLLGQAVYTWAYTEWDLIYSVRWATGRDMSDGDDILHSRPATVDGEQRLNRWAPPQSAATPGPIQHSDIEGFITQVEDGRSQTTALYEWFRTEARSK